MESHIAVQLFPLPPLLPLTFLFSRCRALPRPSETHHLATISWCWLCGSKSPCGATSSASQLRYRGRSSLRNGRRRRCRKMHVHGGKRWRRLVPRVPFEKNGAFTFSFLDCSHFFLVLGSTRATQVGN